MEIVRIDNPLFWQYWEGLTNSVKYQHPLFSEYGLDFYKEYFFKGFDYEDKSFIVVENKIPLAGAIICLENRSGKSALSGYGRGVNYVENQNANLNGIKAARKTSKNLLNSLWSDHQADYILLRDYVLINGSLSNLCRSVLDRGGEAKTLFLHTIDLSKSMEEIHKGLTKSCRHSVNWGLKNLTLEIKNSKTITTQDMENLRVLHIKEVGRETRSKESWDILYSLALKGQIFMINGLLDGNLVSSAIFMYNKKCCLYGVSASSHEMFKNPIGHAVIWKAIGYAKEMGCNYFDFGDLTYNGSGYRISNKENNINRFKKSFGGETKVQLIVEWSDQGSCLVD